MSVESFSKILLDNSTLEDCESLFSTMIIDQSYIRIYSCIIRNMTGLTNTGGIQIRDNALFILEYSSLTGNYGDLASDILAENCLSINITFSKFYFNHNKPMIVISSSFLQMADLEILGNHLFYTSLMPDSVISLSYMYYLEIQRCVFSNLNSFDAPIKIISEHTRFDYKLLDNVTQYLINSSNFTSCSSQFSGGVLFINPYFNINILNCIFKSNIAFDSGGVLMFSPLM